MSSINSRVPPLRLMAVDTPTDGQIAAYQASSGKFEWVANSGGGGTVTSIEFTSPLTGGTITSSGTVGITQSSATTNGYLSSTDWSTFNNKQDGITQGNLTETTSSILTITGGSSAVIGSGTTIAVTQSSGTTDGYLSSTDWSTFNDKQDSITQGNLTESTSSILTITGGTNAVIGSGTTIAVAQSSGTTDGYLSSTDWTTFNNKGIGDVSGSGTANQLTYWDGSSSITGSTKFTIDATVGDITATGQIQGSDYILGGGGLNSLALTSVSGEAITITPALGVNTGQIYISEAPNDNIQITPDGTGKIDLDGLLWPNTDGTNGQVLQTDGAGTLSFATVSGGGTSPGGSDGDFQINDSGSFGGSILSTNKTTTITLNSGASGDPQLQMTSNTKSITLTVDTNNKLKVEGALYSWELDASSGTGGLTFPDGTTQTSAASTTATIGGTIANTQVAYGSGADTIQGSNNLTFDGTNLSVAGYVKSGTGIYDTNGATDLTLQTNGGTTSGTIVIRDGAGQDIEITPNGGVINLDGLKWPTADGTNGQVLQTDGLGTLSFATVSGGASVYTKAVLPTVGNSQSFAGYTQWAHISFPFGIADTASGNQTISTDQPLFVPVIARRTDTLQYAAVYINTAATSTCTVNLGVYEDNDGEPGVLLGQGVVDVTTTGTKYATLTAETGQSLDTKAGQQYFIALVRNNSVNFTVLGVDDNKIPQFVWRNVPNANYGVMSQSGSNNTLPSTASFTTGFAYNFIALGIRWS